MNNYYIVSFSGGKDSTAMLLHLLELKKPIDEVIYCDTYKEFPALYEHVAKVKEVVVASGIKFTELRAEHNFDFYMFEYMPKRKNPEKYGHLSGKSWANSRFRWCTGDMKVKVMDRYFKGLKDQGLNVIRYVGIAADEVKRLERKDAYKDNKVYPLVEWGWTEQDCLDYCYSLGYTWNGLYDIFDRVSCWCCPLQPLESLRKLRDNFPDLWQELINMDNRTWGRFRTDYSVEQLDKRFAFEKEFAKSGKSLRSREFFKQLKEYLDGTDNIKS